MLTLLYFLDFNHINMQLLIMEVNDFSFSISWWFVAIHGKMMDIPKDRLNSHFFGKQGIIILESNNRDALNFDHFL